MEDAATDDELLLEADEADRFEDEDEDSSDDDDKACSRRGWLAAAKDKSRAIWQEAEATKASEEGPKSELKCTKFVQNHVQVEETRFVPANEYFDPRETHGQPVNRHESFQSDMAGCFRDGGAFGLSARLGPRVPFATEPNLMHTDWGTPSYDAMPLGDLVEEAVVAPHSSPKGNRRRSPTPPSCPGTPEPPLTPPVLEWAMVGNECDEDSSDGAFSPSQMSVCDQNDDTRDSAAEEFDDANGGDEARAEDEGVGMHQDKVIAQLEENLHLYLEKPQESESEDDGAAAVDQAGVEKAVDGQAAKIGKDLDDFISRLRSSAASACRYFEVPPPFTENEDDHFEVPLRFASKTQGLDFLIKQTRKAAVFQELVQRAYFCFDSDSPPDLSEIRGFLNQLNAECARDGGDAPKIDAAEFVAIAKRPSVKAMMLDAYKEVGKIDASMQPCFEK